MLGLFPSRLLWKVWPFHSSVIRVSGPYRFPLLSECIQMFQSFSSAADFSQSAARIAALRGQLKERGYAGFLVPLADEHQGEYIPASARRLEWLTGFAGSAGLAVVLCGEAAIFVDGRYTLQVREQVDLAVLEPRHLVEDPPSAWLATRVKAGEVIAYDPWLHTVSEVRRFREALEAIGARFEAVETNLVDAIWADRPAPPLATVSLYPETLAGVCAADKIAHLNGLLAERKAGAAVLSQPDSIAWTFNIRGEDVSHTPLPLSFAILRASGRPALFIASEKLSNEVRDYLESLGDVLPPSAFIGALEDLGRQGVPVLVDGTLAADRIATAVKAGGGAIIDGEDPVLLPKATKNDAELAATRKAHIRDGVAMARFLAWVDRVALSEPQTEISAAIQLEKFRAETGELKDLSFDSISAAGPHAAIPHYRVSEASNLPILPGSFYLIDSGAQFLDGTTDITRTIAIGEVTDEMKDRYTRVLKGHVAISQARFPAGTTGSHLDVLARSPLWEVGLDFDHGTGHGVGVFLSVHEGPQRISKASRVALQPGMILSNEPGYYKSGDYGIRIENLIVVSGPREVPGGERAMMDFETITFAPYDRKAIKVALLSAGEREWIDLYHARVRELVLPHLAAETDRNWLIEATQPL